MKLTDEQRTEIQAAVVDMSIVSWGLSDNEVQSYARNVTWWLENRERIESGDE